MSRRAVKMLTSGTMVSLLVIGSPLTTDESRAGQRLKRYREDKGPKIIDVSRYPTAMQAYYKLFSKKCSRCHTLARPINSKKATEKDWKPYVRNMRKKRNSGITAAETGRILRFLAYDGALRKPKKKPARS